MILIGLLLVVAGLSVTVLSVVRSLQQPRGELLTAGAEGRRLIVLAALAALLAAVALAVIPVYASSTGNAPHSLTSTELPSYSCSYCRSFSRRALCLPEDRPRCFWRPAAERSSLCFVCWAAFPWGHTTSPQRRSS